MPIVPPALDDRSFQDLVDELVARIPAHTPEWRNPRIGDPGRTMIDLFAWLSDTILYRANLIPERQRLAYLRLLGMPLKPARPARGLIALVVDDEREPAAVDVLPGAVIEKPVAFTTTQFTTVFPVNGRVFIKRALSASEKKKFDQLLPDLAQVYQLEGQTQIGYRTEEIFTGGAMDSAGTDMIADTVDGSVWIALMAPNEKLYDVARASLDKGSDGAPRAINIGLALAYDIPAMDENIGNRARIPMVWEMTTGKPLNDPSGDPAMLVLEELQDSTQSLARHGVVRLGLPSLASIGAPSNDPRENLGAGVGDSPPRLDAPADAATLISWIRLRVQPGFPIQQLRLSWIGVNAVEVEQRENLPPRAIGISDGGSDQQFDLGTHAKGGIDTATLYLEVRDPLTGVLGWAQVEDLGAWGPLDPVYRVDAEAGTVHFGDGVHGRVPTLGSQIIARGVRVGGGGAGNLAPGSLTKVDAVIDALNGQRRKPEKNLAIKQALPTRGGSDHEVLADAEKRIPAYFQHRDRVVTADDYRLLARQTPSVSVARVDVLPKFKPQERVGGIPGVVSVMVWPAKVSVDFAAPYPRVDRPLLETVHAYLDARRPLATELYTIGCVYKPLGISLGVQIKDGYAREQVLTDVRGALRRYCWPLPLDGAGSGGDWPAEQNSTGGRDGGYPLGRSLTDREIEVVAARVAGVAGVSAARLFEVKNGRFVEIAGTGKSLSTFDLEDFELPELVSLLVVEALDAPASLASPYAPQTADGSGGTAVYVPIAAEVC